MSLITIYSITNVVNNKKYVGSTKNFKRRKSHHLHSLLNNKHHSFHLQNAYNKNGKDNFEFKILCVCKKSVRDMFENFWINYYNSANRKYGYNLKINVFNHSQESIVKISKSKLGKKRTKESIIKQINNRKYYKHSEETKQKISNSNKNKIVSNATKQKISIDRKKYFSNFDNKIKLLESAKKGREKQSKKVNQYDLDMNYLKTYNSIKEAEKVLNLSNRAVAKSIKHGYKVQKQFYFKLT